MTQTLIEPTQFIIEFTEPLEELTKVGAKYPTLRIVNPHAPGNFDQPTLNALHYAFEKMTDKRHPL
jgi:hypothetical protein